MNLHITILGSGAATPRLGRHCSAQVVNMNGLKCLVDCGESTQNQIRAYHQKMQSLGKIFISHLHGDHILGLPGLLSTMHLGGRKDPVDIYSPAGLEGALRPLLEISDTQIDYELRFHEISIEGEQELTLFEDSHGRIVAFPLHHTVPCFGFRFEEQDQGLTLKQGVAQQYQMTPIEIQRIKKGEDYVTAQGDLIRNEALAYRKNYPKKYAYCCDTAYCEDLIPHIMNVDLLCMESTFDHTLADLASQRGHCTAEQAATLALKAKVRHLLLTHFSARYHEVDDLINEAMSVFPNVYEAYDGLHIEVDRLNDTVMKS